MAKKHKNLDNIPIQWDGDLINPQAGDKNQSIPASVDIVWGDNPYTWGDVNFVIEIADGIGTGSRRDREARLQQLDKDKKKRLIRLICRVKGEKVYDEEKEVGDIHIKLEDAELVIEKVLGKIKVEKIDVL
jgi:hypothetical protein